MNTLYRPELLLVDGKSVAGAGLLVNEDGRILGDSRETDDTAQVVALPGKAMLPGLVNAHSHSFQRLIRGRSETRVLNGGNFWSWRDAMYAAAATLSPDDVFDVARMAFLEMALAGITTVGEFHYVHRKPDGSAYPDGNELARRVIAAAESVGIRIALLRVAYFRAGYDLPPDPGHVRFIEPMDEFLQNCEALHGSLAGGAAWMGVAPHSVRAVPYPEMEKISSWAQERGLALHLHASEQRAELAACTAEYGATPVELLARTGVLTPKTTLVHAVHVSDGELDAIAAAGATICACPTTERNLGDGIARAREAVERGIKFAFGTDSETQIDLLEDARELEYHLRLQTERRLLLDQIEGRELAARLFAYASRGGAESLLAESGTLAPGEWADFFTVDLHDPAIAGVAPEHLLAAIVFTLPRAAIRDVAARGEWVVREGAHPRQRDIVRRYEELAKRVWAQK